MKFSIIVPVYNVEDYLEVCVDSIIQQSFTDFELILIDDGSTDTSSEICDKYIEKDSRIKVIHQRNGGLSNARNNGIKEAKGDYIVFVDSDDFILPGSLARFVDILNEDQDVLITELYNVVDVENYVLPETLFHAPRSENKRDILTFVFSKKPNAQAAVQYIVKREAIEKHNISFEEGFYHEDNVYTPLMLSYMNSFAFYTQPWYIRRMSRPNSITNTYNVKRIKDVITLTSLYLRENRFAHLNNKEREMIESRLVDVMCWHLAFYDKYSKSEREEIVTELINNEELLSYFRSPKQTGIKVAFRSIGYSKTLSILSKIKNRGKS